MMLSFGIGIVAASFALRGLAACSGSSDTPAPGDATNETFTSDGSHPRDGAEDIVNPDAGAGCAPGDVAAPPAWQPPRPLGAGKCTPAEAQGYAASVNGTHAVLVAFRNAHPDCTACIEWSPTDPTSGAMIWYSNDGVFFFNFGGCIASLEGDASPSSCGAATQAGIGCQVASCLPSCPVSSSDTFTEFQTCYQQAGGSTCAATSAAYNVACSGLANETDVNAVCTSKAATQTEDIVRFVNLFCGAPTDAGADGAADAPGEGG